MKKFLLGSASAALVLLSAGQALAATTYYTTDKTIAATSPANLERVYRAIIDKDWDAVKDIEGEGAAHMTKV